MVAAECLQRMSLLFTLQTCPLTELFSYTALRDAAGQRPDVTTQTATAGQLYRVVVDYNDSCACHHRYSTRMTRDAAVAPAPTSTRFVATPRSVVKRRDPLHKSKSKSVEFSLDTSQGLPQPAKTVASMDYSMCFSPSIPDVGADVAGQSADYRCVWLWL